MAGGALSGLIRPIGSRTVHLRLTPRTETIAESREILRVIQQFGRVEMFRNLKYDTLPMPNTMIAMYENEDSARKLLEASPLRFFMQPEESGEKSVNARHYQLQANPSTIHHRDQIEQNSYNGSFKVSSRHQVHDDLVDKVPLAGLSELTLRKEEKPWRVLAWEKRREDSAMTLRQLYDGVSEQAP
jgi:hypothetical protein